MAKYADFVEERRERLTDYFKSNKNKVLIAPTIAKDLNLTTSVIYTDIAALRKRFPDALIKMTDKSHPAGNGFVWKEENDLKAPEIIDNSIDVDKNASGVKDPVASAAIHNLEGFVRPGYIYSCKNPKGIETLYLTVRGPFESCDGIQKITVVPVFREAAKPESCKDNLVKIYSSGSGKTYYIYPYEISSKPVKYLYMAVDPVLDCDLGLVKRLIGKFVDIPEKVVYKTVTKEVEKEVEKPVEEKKEDAATEPQFQNHIVSVPDPVISEIKLMLKEQEAAIYKNVLEMMFLKGGDSK